MTDWSNYGAGLNAAVIGASGGIGQALVKALAADKAVASILACSRSGEIFKSAKVRTTKLDLEDEASIKAAADTLSDPLHLVIVATGILHDGDLQPEKSWRQLDAQALAQIFEINTIGPALAAKHFLPKLDRDRRSAFAALSARVGSISDNRLGGWYGYRASKAALNMILKSAAIELARRNTQGLCIGLHPGTVDTGLSEPFQRGVPEEKLFSPERAASQLLDVIAARSPDDSGEVFAWDGTKVPA
ncbi:MAG: SDR family NAD(P)-dependent oxidoreductase [Alphaproteobacteria bacterium]